MFYGAVVSSLNLVSDINNKNLVLRVSSWRLIVKIAMADYTRFLETFFPEIPAEIREVLTLLVVARVPRG